MTKSVLFVTTETSGSQSLWRILSAIVKNSLKPISTTGLGGRRPSLPDLERDGHLYLVRGVGEFDGPIASPEFRYIVNVRDPRDIACNQYYWLTQHPINNASEEEAAIAREKKQAIFNGGIDAAVLLNDKTPSYRFVHEIMNAPNSDVLFISYNQLCCGFDGMIEHLADFLGFGMSKHAERVIDKEKPENLAQNDRWIGQKWAGTDVVPGRHRDELRPETIAVLNERYAALLDVLKSIEQPELRHHYNLS